MKFDLSIVLPCYNEDKNIVYLYKEILRLKLNNIKVEFVFVDNGSTDKTNQEINKIIVKSKFKKFSIKKFTIKRNEGYGGGILYGLRKSRGKIVSWTHADLQTPLSDVIRLYKKIEKKKNFFAKGNRTNNRGFDSIVSRFHEFIASLILNCKLKEINAQPKMLERNKVPYFHNAPKKWTCLDTYFYFVSIKNKFEIITMNVIFKNRIFGKSKWKNNLSVFIKHLFHNFIYIIQLRFR